MLFVQTGRVGGIYFDYQFCIPNRRNKKVVQQIDGTFWTYPDKNFFSNFKLELGL